MSRRPEALTERRFDVVVVGGGVLGAFAAWDAALRGLDVALLEAGDFGGATSSNSLKIVHGGVRYLAQGDLPRMRASMAERSAWLRIAPHLVEPLPVLVPFGGGLPGTRLVLRGAVWASELASRDRNVDVPDDRRVPRARLLDRKGCTARVPALADARIGGGVLFHDALMYSSERLVLELVQGAAEAGAVVVNRIRCEGTLSDGGRRAGIFARDLIGDGVFAVRARAVVNAAGAQAERLTETLLGEPMPQRSVPSLAVNVVVPRIPGLGSSDDAVHALALTRGGGLGGRRYVVVPWRGRALVGTAHLHWPLDATEEVRAAAGDAPSPVPADDTGLAGIDRSHPAVRRLLAEFNESWPGEAVGEEDVLLVHAGLLPARPRRGGHGRGGDRPGASEPATVELVRRASVAVHGEDGGTPVIQGQTVKFTTARRVAEELVDRVCWVVGHESARCRTAVTPLPGAPTAQTAVLAAAARAELSGVLPDDVADHLVRTYGRRFRDVVEPVRRTERWDRRVQPDASVIRAQLVHGVSAEMALTAEDLLFRRTELGARGGLTDDARREAEAVLSDRTSTAGEARRGVEIAGARPAPASTSGDEAPAPFVTWLVDGHAHYHACYGWDRFLAGTVRNLSRAAAAQREPIAAGCLLLAGGAWDRTIEELENGRALPPGWEASSTDEHGSVLLRRGEGLPLFFVRGRQLVSAEGVEVLALCHPGPLPEGPPLAETIEAITEGGGVPVLPWGFGKWAGRRGVVVAGVLDRLPARGADGAGAVSIFLGDNGIRPELWPPHRHFRAALDAGIPVLPGSDPLPLEHHAERAGSYGFRLTGRLDPSRPGGSVRDTLAALAGSPPPFGERAGLVEFFRSQVAMQSRKRSSGATVVHPRGRGPGRGGAGGPELGGGPREGRGG